jgi:cytochrome c oxidase cbb3-type subunit III
MRFLFSGFVLAAATMVVGWAQDARVTVGVNRFDNPEGIEEGRALFQLHCSYCHGARGEGGRGADLTAGQYRRGGSDANLYNTVRNGIGSEMPAVRASDEEVWRLVAFVKRIGSSGLAEKPAGNALAGKALYDGKGGCAACHTIGHEGGSLGPDLTDVGRRRSLKHLEESILAPDADVPVQYRALELVTKAGATVTGIRLNEDDLSIQLRDAADNLRSFLKENVREIRRDRPSLMPPFGTTLNRQEVEDLVAYLNSLRGPK